MKLQANHISRIAFAQTSFYHPILAMRPQAENVLSKYV